jgi:hypothetical protein
LDIQSRLYSIGVTIIQELNAVFEIQYTTKLRIQSVSLTVWVQSDQKLIDLLRGITSLDGILGQATITLIEDDSEVIHQMELKPNKQIDRRGMPFLTNIWSTLGASEAKILTWILLCTSSQLGQQWTEEWPSCHTQMDQLIYQPSGVERINAGIEGISYYRAKLQLFPGTHVTL